MQMNEVAYDLIEILQKQRDSAGIYHNVTDLSFRWGFECELTDIQILLGQAWAGFFLEM